MKQEIIPKIDISELINFGLQSNKSNKIIKQIKKACLNTGFFTVVGHGVPVHLINSILICAKKIF